jgi:hypothetical protein
MQGNGSLLSASNLKEALWVTLNQVKAKRMLPGHADAVAAQAREILRTVKVQLQISGQTNRPVPFEVIEFSEGQRKRTRKEYE